MKAKKVTGLLLAFVMAFSMTACGNSTSTSADSAESSGSGEEAAQDQADSSERVPIRWLTTGDTAAEVIEDGDRIIEEINNRLGIDLTVEIVPEGNTEKVNVAMASGDFPETGSSGAGVFFSSAIANLLLENLECCTKFALKILCLLFSIFTSFKPTSTQKRRPVVSTDGVLRNVIDFIF